MGLRIFGMTGLRHIFYIGKNTFRTMLKQKLVFSNFLCWRMLFTYIYFVNDKLKVKKKLSYFNKFFKLEN